MHCKPPLTRVGARPGDGIPVTRLWRPLEMSPHFKRSSRSLRTTWRRSWKQSKIFPTCVTSTCSLRHTTDNAGSAAQELPGIDSQPHTQELTVYVISIRRSLFRANMMRMRSYARGFLLGRTRHDVEQFFYYISSATFSVRSYDHRCTVPEFWLIRLVPRRGLEPPPTYVDQHLKLARLPIPPPGHFANQSDFKLSYQTANTTKTIPVACALVDLTL